METNPQEDMSGRMEPAFEHVVRPADFGPLTPATTTSSAGSIDFLLDVSLQVSVELGRTEMTIREVLNLGPGSVISLNRLAGEPVDILVNGKIIARGEVVVIDEKFGVRVIDIMSARDRISSLR